ncbi:SCO2400 family protein [Streptomyces nigra]|uniref:SCO2400 family protein n=1 Tax=Streptomyces nigra TaxID=1827580 RepID=UPI00341E5D60
MDYCSSCRRHLNGALVCPGCGAYAPDIAPSVAGPARPAMPGPAATGRQPDTGPWFDASFHDGTAHVAPDDDFSDLPEDVEGAETVTGAPQGRAARRRQRVRWKKNQRRAVVATAVALVGGGLTLTSLDRQSGDRAQAATAPEQPHTELSRQRQIEPTHPEATVPDGSGAPRAGTPAARPSTTDVAREPVSSSHTTRQLTRSDAASTPGSDTPRAPRTQPTSPPSTTAPGTGGGSSSGGQQQTPDPAPTDGTGTGATQEPNNPQAPQDTSPEQLCVLGLLCLG